MTKGQNSFMQHWHTEANRLVKYNLQLLCGHADSKDHVDVEAKYTFPEVELAIITDYLASLADNAGIGLLYHLPSYLPCFGDSAAYQLRLHNIANNERYTGRSPLLVNFALFRIQDALLRVQADEPLLHSTYAHKWIECFAPGTDWDQLIYKPIASAAREEWHKLDLSHQYQVIIDLEYFSRRILKTPFWRREYTGPDIKNAKDLGRFIVKCWNPRVFLKMDFSFAPETRNFWSAAGFVLKSSRRRCHAEATSTATSHSLGRISNKFVPQARSLPSHRF